MTNKIASVSLVIALVCSVGGSSVLANTRSELEVKTGASPLLPEVTTVSKKDSQANDKLRTGMLKLVAEAKAGKIVLAERPQIQPAKSNNLSKGTKIAIGVGIAVAVIAVIVIVKADKAPGDSIRIF
jgi:hypothetical protein